MRRSWVAGGFALVLAGAFGFSQDLLPRRSVPAREIPVPDTVSPELQAVIARPMPALPAMPKTAEGWKLLQREADVLVEQRARHLAQALGAKVEPLDVGGVKCFRVTPKTISPDHEKNLLVHVHGGAYVFNGGQAATAEAVLLADACKMPVLSIDYRMPPDFPFPAAPDDVLAVWKVVLKEHDPRNIVMGGTSAGAGLIMTTMLRCKADKLPMPAALFLGTPGADLSKTGDSLYINAEIDHILGRYEGRAEACIKLYAGGKSLKEPLISPIYGDLSGFPPAILITGTRDLLLSATSRTHRKLRAAGVSAELHVYEGMSHGDYLGAFPAPESLDALGEIAAFFNRQLRRATMEKK